MKVGELMTESVSALTSDMSLAEAARIMQRENLGALPVAADGFLIGMLTDRDITTRCVAAGQDPASVAVEYNRRIPGNGSWVFCKRHLR